jgi:hypothetical protein
MASLTKRKLLAALAAASALALVATVIGQAAQNDNLEAKGRASSAENARLVAANDGFVAVNATAENRAAAAERKARTALAKAKASANRILARERVKIDTQASQLRVRAAALQAREVELERREKEVTERENALEESPPPPPSPSSECHPSYEGACLDPTAYDYDCEGGSGDGPMYTGYVTVVGPDEYGLDGDGDGEACE